MKYFAVLNCFIGVKGLLLMYANRLYGFTLANVTVTAVHKQSNMP